MDDLVGREADIAFLLEAWTDAQRDGRAVVLLSGEGGVGRTEVVAALTERVRTQGAEVAVARALDLPGQAPCWTVLSALRRSLAGGGRAVSVPEQRGGGHEAIDPPDDRPGTAGGVVRVGGLLAELSRAGPVMLVVEDVHLGDSSYVDLLHYLLAEPGPGPLLVVATYRTEAVTRVGVLRSALTRLSAHGDVRVRELEPLPPDAVRRWVHRRAPDDAALAEKVWRRSAGNPAIIRASLRDSGGPLPVDLRALALARMETLTPAARVVARALAVSGRPLGHRALATIIDLPEAELVGALRDAVDAGVVVVTGDVHALANGLLGEVLGDEVLPGERDVLRSRLDDAVTARSGDRGAGRVDESAERERALDQSVVLEACLAAAAGSGDEVAVLEAQETLAGLLCGPLGRLADGVALARHVLGELPAARRGNAAAVGLRAVLADGLVRRGHWQAAASLLDAPETPSTVPILIVRGRLALERGDTQAAAEALAAAAQGDVGPARHGRTTDRLVELRARLALAEGNRDAVRQLVRRRLVVGRGGPWVVAPMLWLGLRAEAGAPDQEAMSRIRRHLQVVEHQVACADAVLRPAAAAYLALCRAEERRVVGRSDASEWEDVLTVWRSLGEAPLVAYCRWRQGEALLGSGRAGPACDVLRTAAELARTLGAAGTARAVHRTLDRALREFQGSSEPTRSGIDSLTAREEQVLVELSRGLTNRVIGRRLRISEKTVEVHVTHILAKLGTRTRLEASTVWHRAGAGVRQRSPGQTEVPDKGLSETGPGGTTVTRLRAARTPGTVRRREVG